MLNAPATRPAIPASRMKPALVAGRPGDPHDEREVADEAVADPEDHRPEHPGPAGPVPPFAGGDVLGRAERPLAGLQLPPDLGVLPLVGGDVGDLRGGLALVDVLLVALERGHEIGDGAGPEQAGEQQDDRDAQPRAGRRRRHVGAALLELAGPDVGVTPLVGGDPAERGRPAGFLLDRGQGVVEEDRVTLQLEILEALERLGGHGLIVPAARLDVMSAPGRPVLRYLSAREVDGRDAAPRRAPGPRRADDGRPRRRRRAAAEDRRPSPARGFVRARDAGPPPRRRSGRRRRPRRHEVDRRVSRRTAPRGLPTLSTASSCWPTRRPASRPRSSTPDRSPPNGRRPSPAWRSRDSRRPSTVDRRVVALIGAGTQGRSHLAVLGRVLPGVHGC